MARAPPRRPSSGRRRTSPHTSRRRSFRSSSGAAVTNFSPLRRSTTQAYVVRPPRPARRTSSAARDGSRRLPPAPATTRTAGNSHDSSRRVRRAAAEPAATALEERSLQHVDKRADGQLGDEPQQIGRQAAVHGAGSNCRLIAFERRGQQRTGIHPRLINVRRECARRLRRRRPRPERSQSASRPVSATGPAAESAHRARAGTPALQLGGEVPRRQRQPRQPAALDDLGQIGDEPEQVVLKGDGRLKFGPKTEQGPSTGRPRPVASRAWRVAGASAT